MVKAPLAPLKTPDKIKLLPDGALMVAAPLMVIGLLNDKELRLDNKIVDAAMVIGAETEPKPFEWLTFKVPPLSAMLVLIELTLLRSNTPPVPASVKVFTVIDFVCDNVAVLVIDKPAPVNPSTPDNEPISRLEAVWKLKLPVPILPASTLITALAPVSV